MASLENNWLRLIGGQQAVVWSGGFVERRQPRSKYEEDGEATNYPKRSTFAPGSYAAASSANRASYAPQPASDQLSHHHHHYHYNHLAPKPTPELEPEPAPAVQPDDDDASGSDSPRMSSKRINCGPELAHPSSSPQGSAGSTGSGRASDIRWWWWLHKDGTGNLTNWCESPASSAAPQRRHQHHSQLSPFKPATQAEPSASQSGPTPAAAASASVKPAAPAASTAMPAVGERIYANKNKKIRLNYYPQGSRMAALNNQGPAALVASLARAGASSDTLASAALARQRLRRTKRRNQCLGEGQSKARKGPLAVARPHLYLVALMLLVTLGASLVVVVDSQEQLSQAQAEPKQQQQQQLRGGGKPAASGGRLIRSASTEAGEHDLLLELLQSTSSLNEANRLIETLLGSKTQAKPPEPEPPKTDYELIRASGLASSPAAGLANSTGEAPIRVFLPEPLSGAQIELTGNGAQVPAAAPHLKHRGLLDEIIEASALARAPPNRSSEPNAKVHYDDSSAEHQSPHQLLGGQAAAGVRLDAARAAELLRASKQIENILSPPPVVVVARSQPVALGNASAETGFLAKPVVADVSIMHAGAGAADNTEPDGLSNNESISSLIIRSDTPTAQLIANYSHWIVHERQQTGHSTPEAIRFVQAPSLMTTSLPPLVIRHLGPPAQVAAPPEAEASLFSLTSTTKTPAPVPSSVKGPTSASSASNGFSHEQFLSLGSGQQATHVQQQQQLQQVFEVMQPAPEHQLHRLASADAREQLEPAAPDRQVGVPLANGLHEDELAISLQPALLVDSLRQQPPQQQRHQLQQVASSPGRKSAQVLEVSVFADTLEPPHPPSPTTTTTTELASTTGGVATSSALTQQDITYEAHTEPHMFSTASPLVTPVSVAARRVSSTSKLSSSGSTGSQKFSSSGQRKQVNNGRRRKEPRKNGKKANSGNGSGRSGRKKKKQQHQQHRLKEEEKASDAVSPVSQQVVATSASQGELVVGQIRPKAAGVAHLLLGTSSASDRLPTGIHHAKSVPASTGLPPSFDGSSSQPASTSPATPLVPSSSPDFFPTSVDPINGSQQNAATLLSNDWGSSGTVSNSIAEAPLGGFREIGHSSEPAPLLISTPLYPATTSSDLELTELTRAQWSAKREPPTALPAPSATLTNSTKAPSTTGKAAREPAQVKWERRLTPTTPPPPPAPPVTSLINQLAGGPEKPELVLLNEPLTGAKTQAIPLDPRDQVSSSSKLFGKRLVEENPPTRAASGGIRPPAALASAALSERVPSPPETAADERWLPSERQQQQQQEPEGLLNSLNLRAQVKKGLPELSMVHLEAQVAAAEPTVRPLESRRIAAAPRPAEEAPIGGSQLFQYKQTNRLPATPRPQPGPNPILEAAAWYPPSSTTTTTTTTTTSTTTTSTTTTATPLDVARDSDRERRPESHQQVSREHEEPKPGRVPRPLDGRPTSSISGIGSISSISSGPSSDPLVGSARFNRPRSKEQRERQHRKEEQEKQQQQAMNATEQTKAPTTNNNNNNNLRANNSNRWLLRRGDKQRLVSRHWITGSREPASSTTDSHSYAADSGSGQVVPSSSPNSAHTEAAATAGAAPSSQVLALDSAGSLLVAPQPATVVQVDATAARDAHLPRRSDILSALSNNGRDTSQPQQQQSPNEQSATSERRANLIVSGAGEQIESSSQKQQKESTGSDEQRPSGSPVSSEFIASTGLVNFITTTTVSAAEKSSTFAPAKAAGDRVAQQSQLQLQFQWPPVSSSGADAPRDGLRRWRQGERKRRRGEPSTTTTSTSTAPTTTTTTSTHPPTTEPVQVSEPRSPKPRVSLANLFKRLPVGVDLSQQVVGLEQGTSLAADAETSSSSVGPGEQQQQATSGTSSYSRALGEPRLRKFSQHQLQHPHPQPQVQVAGGGSGGALVDELRASALVKTMINLGAPGGTFQSSSSSSSSPPSSSVAAAAGASAMSAEPAGDAGPRIRAGGGDLHKSGQMEGRHERRKFIAVASGPEFPSVDSRASLHQQALLSASAISSTPQPPLQHPQPPPQQHPPEPALWQPSEADWRLQMRASRPRHLQTQPRPQLQLQSQQTEAAASSSWPHPPAADGGDVSPWTPALGGHWRAPPGQRHPQHEARLGTPIGWLLVNGSRSHGHREQDTEQALAARNKQASSLIPGGGGINLLLAISGTTEAPPTLLVYDELLGSEQSAAPARTTQASQPDPANLDQLLPLTTDSDYRPPILGSNHFQLSPTSPTSSSSSSSFSQSTNNLEQEKFLNQGRVARTGNGSLVMSSGSSLLELARRAQLSRTQEVAILIIVFSCGALVLALVAMALSIKCRIAFSKATTSNDADTAANHLKHQQLSRPLAVPAIANKSLSKTKIAKREARRSAKRAVKEAETRLLLAQQRATRHTALPTSDSEPSPATDPPTSDASINHVDQSSRGDLQPVLASGGKTAANLLLLSPPGAPKVPLATRLKRSLKRQKRSKRRLVGEMYPHREYQAQPTSSFFARNISAGGTLRERISGTITSRLLKMQLPRLLPYFALDYSNNPQQQQIRSNARANLEGQFAFDVHRATTSDLQASNGKKLASPLTVGDLLVGSSNITKHHPDRQDSSTRPLPNMEQENFHLKSPAKQLNCGNININKLGGADKACSKALVRDFMRKRPATKLTGCQCVSCTKAKQEVEPTHNKSSLPDASQQQQPLRNQRLPFGAASSVLRQPEETVTGPIYRKEEVSEVDQEYLRRHERKLRKPNLFENEHFPTQVSPKLDNLRYLPSKQASAINNIEQNMPTIINNTSSNESSINFQRPLPETSGNQQTEYLNRYQDEETDNYHQLNNIDHYATGEVPVEYPSNYGDSLVRDMNQQQATTDNQLVEAVVYSNNYFCSNKQPTKQHNQRPNCNCKLVMQHI